jgi:hypothetical protein
MTWSKEPSSVNDKPGYRAGTTRADYRIVPVNGGFRLHYKLVDGNTWVGGEWRKKLMWVKETAESLDREFGLAIPATVCAEFRQWLGEIGAACAFPKTAEEVYVLWCDYSRTCSAYDQSPVKSEFLDWYRDQLGIAPAEVL